MNLSVCRCLPVLFNASSNVDSVLALQTTLTLGEQKSNILDISSSSRKEAVQSDLGKVEDPCQRCVASLYIVLAGIFHLAKALALAILPIVQPGVYLGPAVLVENDLAVPGGAFRSQAREDA